MVKRIFTDATAVIHCSSGSDVYSVAAPEMTTIETRLTSTAAQKAVLMCLSSSRSSRTSGSSSTDE
ncbi:hypothetical protein D3C85_1721300 [compost metagenome]